MRSTFLMLVTTVIFSSCEKDEGMQPLNVIDIDGNAYNTIAIGSQIWMAENLRVTHYNDGKEIVNSIPITDPVYINNYGRLYRWDSALKVCPEGWHLPSAHDWFVLLNYLENSIVNPDSTGFLGEKTGDMLKSNRLWIQSHSNDVNSTGFSALPSGGYQNGNFGYIEFATNFWSSTEGNEDQAFGGINIMYDSPSAFRGYMNKEDGHCVRCLKNK